MMCKMQSYLVEKKTFPSSVCLHQGVRQEDAISLVPRQKSGRGLGTRLGCHAEIRNSSIQMNIPKHGNPLSYTAEQTMTGLSPESYEVLFFDWESDGSVPSTPSYVGHVNMTGPEPELLSSVSPTNRNTPRREMLL